MPEPHPPAPSRRLGPRPLPLHLGMMLSLWGSSSIGLLAWKSGLLTWKPGLEPAAAALHHAAANVGADRLAPAVELAARRRLGRFMAGVQLYRGHPYRRDLPDPPCLWSEGAARLLDYGPADGRAVVTVLVVPSLINRGYILDLMADRSLLRYLARAGIRPLLLDWGWPGEVERAFSLTDYVAGPLDGALEAATEAAGGPVALLGYCMGGLLALALAARRRRAISHIALLATPWNFHADADAGRRIGAIAPALTAAIDKLGFLPSDWQNMLFAGVDLFQAPRKFAALPALPEPARTAFVALEDWVNDGVPLAGPVARECLTGWYGENRPATGNWRIAGRVVDPAAIRQPVLLVVPGTDRIVPPASARALAAQLPAATVMEPRLGHIGLAMSSAAAKVWAGLAEWLCGGGFPKAGSAR